MRNRNHSVLTRYNDAEYEKLVQRIESTGLTMQTYMLNSSLGAKLTTATDREILKIQAEALADIDKQLRGIGTNLNQIAHNTNAYGYTPTLEELHRLQQEYESLKMKVRQQWQLTRQLLSHQSLMEGLETVSSMSSETKK